ncbi:MAG TPA: hypothetical protein PJ999_09815 [Paracoccus sp. (in: a-proteobacteria)]|nr:hypothetical protein [Paracoccus sp. (in: a-proteobacteria)]
MAELLLVVVALASLRAAEVSAETISYDPESCTTETDGRVFVRLASGLAFAFPAFDLLRLRDGPVDDPGPVADPDEPEGCPLNPIVAHAMVVRYQPVAPRSPGEPADGRWRPELLQIFSWGGPVALQDIALDRFSEFCIKRPEVFQHGRALENVSPVLQECRGLTPGTPDILGPSTMVARPGTHIEHEGRRFAVRCDGAFSPGGSRSCDAHYRMRDGLSLMYRFEDGRIPLAHVAEFDLQVRAFIEARRVPEYDQ